MLEYISKQIQAQAEQAQAVGFVDEEAQMNDAILECAHLVQELDDLTIDGTEADSTRPFTKIDIPLEDDVEITAVEMNMLDGRVTNVPADATVQESDTIYIGMRTPEDFYQEAMSENMQYMRESDVAYQGRIQKIADQKYAAYKKYCIQEGLYGFDKLNVTDQRVPNRIVMECGNLGGDNYSTKIRVDFQVNPKNQIMKKQLDAITEFRRSDLSVLQEAAFKALGEQTCVDSAKLIWSFVTPSRLLVPAKPADRLVVAIECEIDGTSDSTFLEWSMPVKGGPATITQMSEADASNMLLYPLVINKNWALHMDEELAKLSYRVPDRFTQEAIDFGNPDEPPASDPNAASVSFDAPPADGMQQPAGDAAGADAPPPAEGDAAAPPAEGDVPADAPAEGTDDKEVVDTNNVSDQIAEKVADETQSDAAAENDINIDGMDASDAEGEQPTEEELNAELGDTPATEDSIDSAPAETSDADFDNMTMDEMLAQGQEKMKGMTMQQIKAFLQGDYTSMAEAPPPSDDAPAPEDEASVQESFQLVLEGAKEKGQTVRNRISNAMEDMQKNLKTMHEALSKDSTRREIQKLWASVNTSSSETFGVNFGTGVVRSTMSAIAGLVSTVANSMSSLFAGGFSSSETTTYSGENFRKSIQYVDSFLKTATKKKRIKNTFTGEEIGKLTRYRDDINDLIDTAEQAFSAGKAAMDVSLKQLDAAVVKVMDQYDSVKAIVTTQAANDAVIEEAFF